MENVWTKTRPQFYIILLSLELHPVFLLSSGKPDENKHIQFPYRNSTAAMQIKYTLKLDI